MADDTERLIVLLEARLTDFEKNMLKASGVSQKNFNQIKKQSRSATRQMEQDMQRSTARINQALASTSTQIGALGRTFAGAFAGGVFAGGLTGLAAGIRNIVRETASLNDEAAKAGLAPRCSVHAMLSKNTAALPAGMPPVMRNASRASACGARRHSWASTPRPCSANRHARAWNTSIAAD